MKTPYKQFTVTLETLDKYTSERDTYEHSCPAQDETEAVTITMDKFFSDNPNMKAKLKSVIEPIHKDGETILQIKTPNISSQA